MSTQFPPSTSPGPSDPNPQAYGGPPPAPQGTDPLAILGLVFAFLFWPLGLILSIIGITRTGKGKRAGRGLAIAGAIISVVAGIIAIAVIAAIAGAANDASDDLDAATEQFEQDMAELEASAGAMAPNEQTEDDAAGVEETAAAEVTVGVGEPATVGNVTFTVTSEECGETLIGDETFGVEAQGEFCLFGVSVENGARNRSSSTAPASPGTSARPSTAPTVRRRSTWRTTTRSLRRSIPATPLTQRSFSTCPPGRSLTASSCRRASCRRSERSSPFAETASE